MLIDDFYSKCHGLFPAPNGVIKAHNIADLYCETGERLTVNYPSREAVWSFRRPFPITWIEFSFNNSVANSDFAILAEECSMDDLIVSQELCLYRFKNQLYLMGIIEMAYDKEGKYLKGQGERINELPLSKEVKALNLFPLIFEGVRNLTLNFLYCKNVQLIENSLFSIDIKRRRQDHRDWFTKFYTLDIRDMKRVLETEGEIKINGHDHAWHLCRGYFKTYKEKAMFGKYFGTFFVPAHARGSSNIGMIFKDYRIIERKENGYR